jgi:serine/threonine protein kinase
MSSIAQYNLLDPIGNTNIGEVFRARDSRNGRTVSITLISPAISGDPAHLSRLLEDARAAMVLSHPNIATLYEVGEADGRHYLAHEFAAGRSLREETDGAAMNLRRALDLAIQIADGTADAHAHGIIHGDLRPETITVTPKGNAKILDFGLSTWTTGGAIRASAAQAPDSLSMDANSVVAYLSPEQAIGTSVDPRTDVFSLATLTYEMLTGISPFVGPSAADTVVNVIRAGVAPPSEASPGVPEELDPILARALARDLSRRQQSVAALAAELRTVAATLDAPTGNIHEPASLLAIDEAPDRKAATLLAGALLMAIVAAGLVWWLLSR